MSAQQERDKFWSLFDEYVKAKGNNFFVTHQKSGINQAAGNINNVSPMAMETICCEYKYMEQTILVQVYINKNDLLFDYLYSKKDELEKKLGYSVEWITSGKISSSVKRIQKKFLINDSIESMVKKVYPYILDFIRVFSPFLKGA